METVVYLDTHVVAWLYAGSTSRIPNPAKKLIDRNQLFISPMVALELQYLFEIGRVTQPAENVCGTLRASLGIRTCPSPFESVVQEALRHTWTRDPFDRIITAQASLNETPLLTKDQNILKNYRFARWEA